MQEQEATVTVLGFIATTQYVIVEGTGPKPDDNYRKVVDILRVPKKALKVFLDGLGN